MGLPSSRRLKSNREFQKVRSDGYRVNCGPFILNLQLDATFQKPARFGVVASRRVGNAVKRNRGKRLLREVSRQHLGLLPDGMNLVAILRSGYDKHDFTDLEERFSQGLHKLKAKVSTHH